MEDISLTLLKDMLNVVQLSRETAAEMGEEKQAARFESVMQQLQDIVQTEEITKPSDLSLYREKDTINFDAVIKDLNDRSAINAPSFSPEERNKIINSMAAGGMDDKEIARQLGITRDEVAMTLNLSKFAVNARRFA